MVRGDADAAENGDYDDRRGGGDDYDDRRGEVIITWTSYYIQRWSLVATCEDDVYFQWLLLGNTMV